MEVFINGIIVGMLVMYAIFVVGDFVIKMIYRRKRNKKLLMELIELHRSK